MRSVLRLLVLLVPCAAAGGPVRAADLQQVQRGYAVYAQVCSSCHALRGVGFADLAGMGLDRAQILALAASRSVPDGTDAFGRPLRRPGQPTDPLPPPPYVPPPGQAVPPDLSRIALVLPGGAPDIARILTGYRAAPHGASVPPGSFFDPAAPGGMLAMPPPLAPGVVTLAGGVRPTVPAMAADVAAFLDWCAHPHRAARRRIGIGVMLYLALMAVFSFLLKRRIWSHAPR